MTTEEPVEVDDDAMIVTLSDYLDGALSETERADVEKKIADHAAWKRTHDELRETRNALSGLQRARAPSTFNKGVTQTIHKRSAGRFFVPLGDRMTLLLLVIALVGIVAIAGVLWSSSTGSLKIDRDKAGDQGSALIDKKP